MQGAILNGLYNLDSQIKFQCPTGFCVWPDFTTLATMGRCQNVTSSTLVTCQEGQELGISKCKYTTPAGFVIGAHMYGRLADTAFNSTASVESVFRGYETGKTDRNYASFVSFATANIIQRDIKRLDIMECNIGWSARRYSGFSVRNGTYSPGVIDESFLGRLNRPPELTNLSSVFRFTLTPSKTNASDSDIFNINISDHYWIGFYLAKIFSSSDEDDFGKVLRDSPSIEMTVHNITDSITSALRNSRNATRVVGDAFADEQFISVSWPWITLLLVEVLMGLALLGITLQITKREGLVSWKSSSLVPFFIETRGWDTKGMTDMSVNGIENFSRRIHGSLVSDRRTATFFKTDK
ncbi:hypothetical protein F5Y04DRAFT_291810 [Hypomontagnella monticulosa]|nr:hypothetical protein F5Y04DRAFT_291810 [Hypomontagnella monticulosa]